MALSPSSAAASGFAPLDVTTAPIFRWAISKKFVQDAISGGITLDIAFFQEV